MNDSLRSLVETGLGLRLSDAEVAAFDTYAEQLIAWNQHTNLTAITDREAIQVKHFLDSLSILILPELPEAARVIDVGSGAGLPGLALKIARPEWNLTLLEATGKKVAFLDHMIASLGLPGVVTLNMRAEDAGQDTEHRAGYDLVVARAVARLPVLAEYLLPLCRPGGLCIAMKGGSAANEIQDAGPAIQLLGGELERMQSVSLPDVEEIRYLICLRKTGNSPSKYPRRAGIPAKKPL